MRIALPLLRSCACATGKDGAADTIGKLEDKAFETLRDMWTPDEKKTAKYYQDKEERTGTLY